MPETKEILDPISGLAEEYRKDLDKLRQFDELISAIMINDQDVKLLQGMCYKHTLKISDDEKENKVTKENFSQIKGRLEGIIITKYKDLSETVLGRVIEETPGRLPTKKKVEKQKVPKSLK